YDVTAVSPNPIRMRVDVRGKDSSNGTVEDADTQFITLPAPGIDVVEFTPDPDTTEPGQYVDFTLQIQSVRPNVDITDLSFASDQLSSPQCDNIDKWTGPDGGDLDVPVGTGVIVECEISGVKMPPDSPSDRYTLAGTLTAKAGTAEAVVEVVSDPVLLQQPSIHVRKEVDRIIRGTEEVQEPALPG